MIYSVHIYSDFDAVIDNNSCKTQINNKFGIHIQINTECENNMLVYSAQSFYGYKFLPYMINLNEIIMKNNNNLAIVKNYIGLNQNICEIILKPNLIPDCFSLQIKEKLIVLDKKKFKVCVFLNRIEINNVKFEYKHYFNFKNVSVQAINKHIIVINSCEGKHYVLIFSIEEGIIICNYEDIVDKIEINNKEYKIKLLKKYNNFYQTGKVEEYFLENEFKLGEQYFVKLGTLNANLNVNLVAYAFMHCIKQKDFNFAKNFLCSDLRNKLSQTTLATYFENLVDFEKCKYCQQDCLFVKYKNEENYKPIKFILKENKIVDIK